MINNTLQLSQFMSRCLVLATLLAVSACSQLPTVLSQPSESLEDQAAARLAQGDYTGAAQLYQLSGESAQDPRRSLLLMRGARAALRGDNDTLAQNLLDGVSPGALNERDQAAFELLRIQTFIAGKPPSEGLKYLPIPEDGTPAEVAAQTWALRAKLFYQVGDITQATHALVQREVWLLEPDQIQDNHRTLWERLRERAPDADAANAAGDKTTAGWLALANIGNHVWADRSELERALQRWSRRFPNHPAGQTILPKRFDFAAADLSAGERKIGLALPLTGNFSGAATAIQNGFMAGYYASIKQAKNNKSPTATIRVYDSNALDDPNALLLSARADNIDVLVGPLQKGLATELSQRNDLGFPVLALNYTENSATASDFYQFGLAPEDEARAAARRGLRQGMSTAIALVPEGEWGARILEAFRDEFSAARGQLLDYATYNPNAQDHGGPIKRLLRNGQGGPGENGEQAGADMIFIAAQPQQARQIRQQLRFHRASRLPVMATSHVFSGVVNRGNDTDLMALLLPICPGPSVIQPTSRRGAVRSTASGQE